MLVLKLILTFAFLLLVQAATVPLVKAGEDKSGEDKSGTGEKYEILVVLIYDQNCKVACTKVKPMMQEISDKYKNKIKYLELNASQFKESIATAASYGVKNFLADSTDLAPIVGVFSNRGKKIKELLGYKGKEVYEAAIDKALANN